MDDTSRRCQVLRHILAGFRGMRRGGSRHGIEGTVVKVHHDRANGRAGWIKIRHRHHYGHARRGSTSVAASLGRNRFRRGGRLRTFAVNSSTPFAVTSIIPHPRLSEPEMIRTRSSGHKATKMYTRTKIVSKTQNFENFVFFFGCE